MSAGKLPKNNGIPWRGNSAMNDGSTLPDVKGGLVGGYYDAGDHVKFGLPMAFTVTMLSWGAIEFGHDVAAAGEWRHALEAIKWGTDYFVKAHTHPFVYWAEVRMAHVTRQRPFREDTGRADAREWTAAINLLLLRANDGCLTIEVGPRRWGTATRTTTAGSGRRT